MARSQADGFADECADPDLDAVAYVLECAGHHHLEAEVILEALRLARETDAPVSEVCEAALQAWDI